MDELTWTFSAGDAMGTRAVALGFAFFNENAAAELAGAAFEAEGSALNPTGYTDVQTIPLPTGLENAVLIVQFEGGGPGTFNPANVTFTYGGQAMTVAWAEYCQQEELDQGGAIAYLWVGDGSTLADDTLELAITGVSNPNIVDYNVHAQFVNGIADSAPTVFEAGTVDVHTSPLTLDPEPPTGDSFAFVWTSAFTAAFGSGETMILSGENWVTLGTTLDTNNVSGTAGYWLADVAIQYDCACEVDENAQTLAEMRVKLLRATGYAAQAASPPPGVAAMYNEILDTSQRFIYQKYKALQTERFFSWVLTPGVRFYGLWDNGDECAVKLNRYKITGAWIQDLNNVWWPLVEGIDPTFYTLDANFGWPNYYEVRQCIEVFPAPQAAYTLWIKGRFELLPFADDADTTTIDADPVLNYAKYLAKSHKGMKDAEIYQEMAFEQVSSLIAGGHVTRRYIPGTSSIPVPTPPVMVHFES